ncbi:sulfotransferase family protein [Rubrivirga sp. IMCC43871]|uniref:sulfotransferase family protein n=1 Tax=Rubrivirga sp. IMCC43871 TaxID=3391575 RepID=UPI00398FF889
MPDAPPDFPAPGAVPLGLIGGTGRSGTTALRDALACHPDVLAFPELRFAIDPDGLVDTYRAFESGWSPFHADVRLRRLEALLAAVADDGPRAFPGRVARKLGLGDAVGRVAVPAYTGHRALEVCPTFRERSRQLIDALTSYTYAGAWTGTPGGARAEIRVGGPYGRVALAEMVGGFWRAVAADSLAHAGRDYFLDKQTWSVLWFDAILDLLPSARLVHVIRDPRDIAASYTSMGWGPSRPADAARLVADVLDRWAHVRQQVPADRVLEVRLEDLAAEPEARLREVCTFLGIAWHDAVLGFDLSRVNAGRWRGTLDAEAQATLTPHVEAFGYGE